MIVFIDYYTKYVIAVLKPDQRAQIVADAFIEHVVLQHGVPKYLLFDQGSNIRSQLIADVSDILNSGKFFTTAYHPASDSLCE